MYILRSLFISSAIAGILCAADYRLLGKINIAGEGGWDYLTIDPEARRLYVSHATHVVVVDLDTNKVVGDIPDTPGVHGIAVAPKLGRGFISSGRANNVAVFDLITLKLIKQVPTGQNPDAIIYDPSSNRVVTFNGRSNDATVIDAGSAAVKATIPLGGKPEFAVVDGHGKAWVNIEDIHEIVEIDLTTSIVKQRYSLTGCEEPSGLAFDPGKKRLYSVCANKTMAVSDPSTGKVIATVPIGQGTDGAAFDAIYNLAFSSNGEGTLTVVGESGGKYGVAQTVPTQRGARTMTIDPKTHRVYLPTAEFGPTPEATAVQPRPRPPIVPGTFAVLVVGQ